MWPPSSTGTGIRFSSPRLRLIIAISPNSCAQPCSTASPDSWPIATGPISCLTEVSRVNRPAERLHDQLRPVPVLLRAQLERLDRARLDDPDLPGRDLRADPHDAADLVGRHSDRYRLAVALHFESERLAFVRLDQLDHALARDVALAVGRHDDVMRLEAGLLRRFAGIGLENLRVHDRQDANLALRRTCLPRAA